MNIYNNNETNFNNNGLGFLNNCISALVTESLNGDYILEIEYPLNDKMSSYLVEENIIKVRVSDGSYQLFRIKRITKNYSIINVYALHITYDLLNNMLLDVYPQNLNCQNFGQWILDNTNFQTPFTFESDIGETRTARYVRRNPIEAIMGDIDNSMVNIFGGELKRDNFTIKMLAQRGNNNHVKLLYGKNITEIAMTIDITEMYTRIIPIGFDGLKLPENYVDSPIIDNYITPKCGIIEFPEIKYNEPTQDEEGNIIPSEEEEDGYDNIDDAYEALRNAVKDLYKKGIDKPVINLKIDWLELSKTKQYYNQYKNLESVQLGDIITAEILGIDYTTRVTKITYNVLTDMIDRFEIGSITKTIANTLNNQTTAIKKINPNSILQTAKNNATNLITSAMGGYVYKTNDELFIMDNEDPKLANRVWRWNINGLGYSSTGINGPYGLAMTMDGSIVADMITTGKLNTSVIEGYDSLAFTVRQNENAIGDRTGKITTITQDINTIIGQISDIADITISESTEEAVIHLENVNTSEPIHIDIHPIIDNIARVYPSNNTIIGNNLIIRNPELVFYNETSREITANYIIPIDLYWYDENTFDEFHLDYESRECYVIKRCKLVNGLVVTQNQERIDLEYPTLLLTDGDYTIYLNNYARAYIFTRLMALNAYTAQYATKVELHSSIKQTATDIESKVGQSIDLMNGEISSLNSRLTQTAESIEGNVSQQVQRLDGSIETISGNVALKLNKDDLFSEFNVGVNKVVINSDNFKLTSDGTMKTKNGEFTGTITGSIINLTAADNSKTTFRITSSNNSKYYTYMTGKSLYFVDEKDIVRVLLTDILDTTTLRLISKNGNTSATFSSAGTSNTSDIRYKDNITEIDSKKSLDIITSLNPIEFTYKDENQYHRGLSAQEVEKVLNKNNIKDEIYSIDDESGKYMLNYVELIPDLINCIKEQQKQINELKEILLKEEK